MYCYVFNNFVKYYRVILVIIIYYASVMFLHFFLLCDLYTKYLLSLLIVRMY